MQSRDAETNGATEIVQGLFPGAIKGTFDRESLTSLSFRRAADSKLQDDLVRFLTSGLNDLAPIGYSEFVLGLSGGLDSVVIARLAQLAGAPVTAISIDLGRREETERTRRLRDCATQLKIPHVVVDASSARKALMDVAEADYPWLAINIDTRLIQTLIFREADKRNAVVLATTDRSEKLLGRYTEAFYGQLAPLADVYKTEIAELAMLLNVRDLLTESRPGCEDYWFDDEVLGAGYDVIDPLLHLFTVESWSVEDISRAFSFRDTGWLKRLESRVVLQPHRVVEKTFGVRRRAIRRPPPVRAPALPSSDRPMSEAGSRSSLAPFERLKLELMQGGLTVADSAMAYVSERVGDRPLTLADYASTTGVSLRLEGEVWVNAPTAQFNGNFVFEPRHKLIADGGRLVVQDETNRLWPVELAPVPDYHNAKTAGQRGITEYVHTHTDRARISPVRGCAMRCKFCDIPYEFKGAYWSKPSAELLEALHVALTDSIQPAAHVLISGGTPAARDYGALRQTYLDVLAAFPNTPIDIMMVPHNELIDLEALDRAGINELSLNLEIFDRERARAIMPEKFRHGLDAYLNFIEKAVERMATRKGRPRVRSMLMVGLEEEAATLAGVRSLVERGCAPVLSPFRPDPITDLATLAPPSAETLERIYLKARDIADQFGVALGPSCRPCMHNTLTFPNPYDNHQAHGAPYVI